MSNLTVIHFNDIYEITEASREPVGGSARFLTCVKQIKEECNPLILFSGDAFSPSVMSSVTGGKHIPPVLNLIGVHSATYGNHDFDFGSEAAVELTSACSFAPWMMANLKDSNGNLLGNAISSKLFNWDGVKVGLVGLVEKEWIDTVNCFPKNIQYIDQAEEGRKLAKQLRDQGAQIIIAVTHSRKPNDFYLAKNVPDIDLIVGGHDHDYYVHFVNKIPILNSGCDFKQLSRINISLGTNDVEQNQEEEPIARKARQWKLTGPRATFEIIRHDITSEVPPDEEMSKLVRVSEAKMEEIKSQKLGQTNSVWDARASITRTQECGIGNFITDLMRSYYQTDLAFLGGGGIRSDTNYGPGDLVMGDIMKIFPFIDPTVVFELKGEYLREALENSVSQYPKHEGRFPQLSGCWIEFNPNAEPGKRITDVKIGDKDNLQPLDPEKLYTIAAKDYVMHGGDGFTSFAKYNRVIVEEENGLTSAVLVRNHFLQKQVLSALDRTNRINQFVENVLDVFMGTTEEVSTPNNYCCVDLVVEGRVKITPQ